MKTKKATMRSNETMKEFQSLNYEELATISGGVSSYIVFDPNTGKWYFVIK